MSVPKKKLSKRRVRARRSHHKVDSVHSMESPIPGDSGFIRPHFAHIFNGRTYSWKELKEMMSKKKAAPAAKKATTKKTEAKAEKAEATDKKED